jgi:PTH1 family peptidyl-tRNA hydrolase
MFVVIGLGNPGHEYETTRHNAGFLFVDSLSEEFKIPVTQKKFKAFIGRGSIQEHDVLLVKPQTYMNLSGDSVQQILNYFKVPETHLIVVFDDLDLPSGQVKTRFGGGHGGHNGIRNILECMSSDKFYRVKIGIGKPTHKSATSDWVLHSFDKSELEALKNTIFPTVKERVLSIMREVKN